MVDPRIALCLAELEKKTSELYIKMAEKTNIHYASLIMKFIGYDSLKHSLVFSEIAKTYGLREESVNNNVCVNILGTFFNDAIKLLDGLLKEANEKGVLDEEDLRKILPKLVSYENGVGEEYFVGFVASVFSQSHEEPSIAVKKVLKLIYEDEERHSNLVKEILSKIKG